MAKEQVKHLITKKNSPNTLLEPKKSKQQINKDYYQKNQEQRQKQRREKYQQQKQQTEKQLSKYYGTQAIKVLMSFKEYTELSKEKKHLWLDFNWTMKDCQESIKEGFADLAAIMKLEQVANKLTRDYWTAAKSELKQRGKQWNSLTEEQRNRLVSYWGQEKVRSEARLAEKLTKQELTGKAFEQEIKEMMEISTLHEERGRKGCECWHCELKKEQAQKEKQELNQLFKKQSKERVECPECGRKVKELDEENDICKTCLENYF